jgi:hypothetical protein
MTKPMITIHDLATNEIVEREMNADEFAQHQKDLAADQAEKAAAEAKATARQAVLNKLGLTAEEMEALLS